MKYSIPIFANLRKLLPSVDKLFGEVETTVNDFAPGGFGFALECRAPILTLTVDTKEALTGEAMAKLKQFTVEELGKKFPDAEIEMGEAVIS
jgi:hypothetical protein